MYKFPVKWPQMACVVSLHLPLKTMWGERISVSSDVLQDSFSKGCGLPSKNTFRSGKWLGLLILLKTLDTSYQIQIPSSFICEAAHIIHYYEVYNQLVFWLRSLKLTVVNVPTLTVTMNCFPGLSSLGILLLPLGKEDSILLLCSLLSSTVSIGQPSQVFPRTLCPPPHPALPDASMKEVASGFSCRECMGQWGRSHTIILSHWIPICQELTSCT